MPAAEIPFESDGGRVIRGAIFDVDGTLLDSMGIWDTIGEDYLRSLGYEPREKLNERFRTMSLPEAAAYYISEYGVPLTAEEICRQVNARIERFYREEAALKFGAADFIKRLYDAGVKLAIATATDDFLVEAALRRCGVMEYFSALVTCTHVNRGKDRPDVYRAAMARIGTGREDTVIFEDSLKALRTAREDGFYTVGVFDPFERDQAGVQALAHIYLKNYTDWEEFRKFALT